MSRTISLYFCEQSFILLCRSQHIVVGRKQAEPKVCLFTLSKWPLEGEIFPSTPPSLPLSWWKFLGKSFYLPTSYSFLPTKEIWHKIGKWAPLILDYIPWFYNNLAVPSSPTPLHLISLQRQGFPIVALETL